MATTPSDDKGPSVPTDVRHHVDPISPARVSPRVPKFSDEHGPSQEHPLRTNSRPVDPISPVKLSSTVASPVPFHDTVSTMSSGTASPASVAHGRINTIRAPTFVPQRVNTSLDLNSFRSVSPFSPDSLVQPPFG
jgi:hypothetical protein